ncbi:MDR family MFS transporter [Paenibacillus senegalimassiliensis]|uniref:MDR family MFS transporter n=1 Tax=Paenibacillus senegalimassiliensis TaxID=1737426 RepID=UPI00073E6192|nr:MDR family MFS transporter [Paenibacillus senegalimassiliensis]
MEQTKRKHTGIVLAALLLGILMSAMDNTIITTATATIVGDIGGLDRFVWVSSAYMISEMAGMPIFGKLSDMYGRKRFFLFGIIVFIIGSVLCGTAQTMDQLILYRIIQGISGGALIPIAFTIMYDLVPLEERGKLGGMFGAVFGLASILGPLLGAFITEYLNWHWIFFINLPLGIAALAGVAFFYHEAAVVSKQRIDWAGAISLVSSVVSLMLALELGGKTYAWGSAIVLSLFALSVISLLIFIIAELRAAEPIISFRMFTNRLYATSNAIATFGGAAFITASVFIPIYIQGVQYGTAVNSGLVLLPMMLSTVVSSTIGGFLMNKFSYRSIMIPATVIFAAGFYLLSTITPGSGQLFVTISLVIAGLGIGFSFPVLGNASIHPFPANQRGTASSTLTFMRSLGMAVGVTIFGIIQNHLFVKHIPTDVSTGSVGEEAVASQLLSGDAHILLEASSREQIPQGMLQAISGALSSSVALTFAWALVPAALTIVFSLAMSKEKLLAQPSAKTGASVTSVS